MKPGPGMETGWLSRAVKNAWAEPVQTVALQGLGRFGWTGF
jgi:hypothetical protein